MIPRQLLPTVLVPLDERPRIAAVTRPQPPTSFRVLQVLQHLAVLLIALTGLWMRRRLTGAEAGRRVRRTLEGMGTVWIKAGQILSLRSDLFPADFCLELGQLRDRGVAFPFDMARRIAEEELGGPLEHYFDQFAETPFAATGVAQLHRARLRVEQVDVAVKIQQPFAVQVFHTDVRVTHLITGALEWLAIAPQLTWSELDRELQATMTRELNFAYEASSLRRLRRTLRRHGVYAPTVFPRYSGTRVLVMEYIQAALISDFIDLRHRDPARLDRWLEANHIEPRRVGERLFHSVFRQVLEDNLFHGDLHPHNLILLRNSRLAVIDCRSAGSLEVEHLTKHALYLRSIADREFATAADVHFLLSMRLPRVDLATVKEELIRVWRIWDSRTYIRELPYGSKSLTSMFTSVNRVVTRHRFAVQWSMTRLARTTANLDLSLQHLHPTMNAGKWLRRYFARAAARTRRARARNTPNRANRALVAAAQLPRMASEAAFFEQSVIRRQARVLEGSTTKAAELLAAICRSLVMLLILIEALLLAAFADQRGDAWLARFIGPQLTGVVRTLPTAEPWVWLAGAGLVLIAHRTVRALGRRFARKPIRVPDVQPTI